MRELKPQASTIVTLLLLCAALLALVNLRFGISSAIGQSVLNYGHAVEQSLAGSQSTKSGASDNEIIAKNAQSYGAAPAAVLRIETVLQGMGPAAADDEATLRANIDNLLQELFHSDNDDFLSSKDDDALNNVTDDDFFDTIILVLIKLRNPLLSQIPSPNDTRSSIWTANERLVNPMSALCNCTTHIDGRGSCCSRVFRRPHKMNNDYRDVVIVRDFYAAVISGYLYHRPGHECWLTPHGEPMNGSTINAYWTNVPHTLPIAPLQDRSICTYLADESLSDGLLLWAGITRRWWLTPLVQQWDYAQTLDDAHRTLFVCYHDLVNGPPTLEHTMQRMLDHFFPGGHYFRALKRMKRDAGGHATSKSREALYLELKRIDRDVFKGWIADAYSMFRCLEERNDTSQLDR